MRKILIAIALMQLITPNGALAQTPSSTNKIGNVQRVWLSGASNFAFRISIINNGVDQLSSCGDGFAYINTSDDNYQAKVAMLLNAYAQQKPVTIAYTTDGTGHCQMNDISM